jgi:hypothetical protein
MRSCLVVFTLLLVLCGCGGSVNTTEAPNPGAPQFTIVSGNWAMALFPQSFPNGAGLTAGGVVNQSGNALSGILHIVGSTCFDAKLDDLIVSGTIAGGTVTLNSAALRGQVLTITATPALNQTGAVTELSGTWSVTGGACANRGTSLMVSVPPMGGTWSGSLASGLAGTATAILTQSGPDVHGFFQVSGNFVFTGSACFASGNLASGSVSGLLGDILLNTSDAGQTQVTIVHDPGPPKENFFAEFAVLSGTCSGNFGQATLAKQ